MGWLQEMPLERFANFVWYMLTRNAEADDAAALKARLWQPPIGAVVDDPRSPWSPEAEGNAMSALKASMGG
jgi:hypothetical protein